MVNAKDSGDKLEPSFFTCRGLCKLYVLRSILPWEPGRKRLASVTILHSLVLSCRDGWKTVMTSERLRNSEFPKKGCLAGHLKPSIGGRTMPERLPEGNGIAADYPGDVGIENDPAVVFAV